MLHFLVYRAVLAVSHPSGFTTSLEGRCDSAHFTEEKRESQADAEQERQEPHHTGPCRTW